MGRGGSRRSQRYMEFANKAKTVPAARDAGLEGRESSPVGMRGSRPFNPQPRAAHFFVRCQQEKWVTEGVRITEGRGVSVDRGHTLPDHSCPSSVLIRRQWPGSTAAEFLAPCPLFRWPPLTAHSVPWNLICY